MADARETVALDSAAREVVRRLRGWQDAAKGAGPFAVPDYGVFCHMVEAVEDMVAALSPAGDGEAQDGWLFFNPDTGVEWSPQHPVESGEAPDADDVRPATASALRRELQRAWTGLAEAQTRLAALSPGGEVGDLVKRLRDWDRCWPAPWLGRAVEEAADALLFAWAEARALNTRLTAAQAESARLGAEVERLTRERDEARAVIDWAAEQACEGLCEGAPEFRRFGDHCSGCQIQQRAALRATEGEGL